MSGGLIASVVAPHTPRIGIEANAPAFQLGLIKGLREMGDELRAMKPDLFVLLSSHWVSTFNWYTTAHAQHEGICIADEAPDLIPGVSYSRKGDPEFAQVLAGQMKDNDIPCGVNDSPHFNWDYGTFVPLQYLDPDATVPLVAMPSVLCSELDECQRTGRLVHEAAKASGRRVVFIASCAMAHAVARGPELWPTEEQKALDHKFMDYVIAGDIPTLATWTPEYCRAAVAEMGGRPLSGMVGASQALAETGIALEGKTFGDYAQSSGSGNVCLGFFPKG